MKYRKKIHRRFPRRYKQYEVKWVIPNPKYPEYGYWVGIQVWPKRKK